MNECGSDLAQKGLRRGAEIDGGIERAHHRGYGRIGDHSLVCTRVIHLDDHSQVGPKRAGAGQKADIIDAVNLLEAADIPDPANRRRASIAWIRANHETAISESCTNESSRSSLNR